MGFDAKRKEDLNVHSAMACVKWSNAIPRSEKLVVYMC